MAAVVPMVEGMANQRKVAPKKPNTPCVGLAAMRDCQEAWSQNVTLAAISTACTIHSRESVEGLSLDI